jgi:hypothetical protein
MGIAHYLWKAFTRPWNMLIVLGASAAAAMTSAPDVLLPLIVAGEAVYLGALVSLPRFRQAIDAQDAERMRAMGHKNAPNMYQLLASLRGEAQKRFNDLRLRCLEMRSIARGARPVTIETDVWTPALDRLLYGFLRLLGQQNSLWRFLRSTTAEDLTSRLDDLKKRLPAAKGTGDERMIRSLEESIAIAEQRLDNYQKAVKNAEFAALELDRVEAKIQALIELAANRGDADLLSDQVDAAAESMNHTEAALNQLQQITGVTDELDEVPPILDDEHKPTVKDRG